MSLPGGLENIPNISHRGRGKGLSANGLTRGGRRKMGKGFYEYDALGFQVIAEHKIHIDRKGEIEWRR